MAVMIRPSQVIIDHVLSDIKNNHADEWAAYQAFLQLRSDKTTVLLQDIAVAAGEALVADGVTDATEDQHNQKTQDLIDAWTPPA